MVGSIRAYWRVQPSVLQCETEEGDLEVKMAKCRNCGKEKNYLLGVNIPGGDWFCSQACCMHMTGRKGSSPGCAGVIVLGPLMLAWWAVKMIFKLIFLPFTLIFGKKKEKKSED